MSVDTLTDRPREVPRWSTVLVVGLLLLLAGGVVGILCAIALVLVRARPRERVDFESLPEIDAGSDGRELVALARRSASVVTLVVVLDLVALLAARYAGLLFGTLLGNLVAGVPALAGITQGMIDAGLLAGLPFLGAAFAFMAIGGRYGRGLGDPDAHLLSARAAIGAGLVELSLSFTVGGGALAPVIVTWGAALVLLPAVMAGARRILAWLGLLENRLLLVGESARAARVLGALDLRQRQEMVRISGSATSMPPALSGWLATRDDRRVPNMQVVLCPPPDEMPAAVALCREIEARGAPCAIGVDFGLDGRDGLDGSAAFVEGVLVAQGVLRRVRPISILVKRLIDILGAVVGIVLFLPVMLPLALLVASDGGSPFFAHERVGLHGRRFRCLKLRSMRRDAKEVLERLLERDPAARAEWERDFKLRDDPRVTRVGEFMRRTSLDELPQFLNVLRGEMSLVGPRPVVARELERYYGPDAAAYMSVKPGMTGLWQISGRNDLSYEERVALDTTYGRSWSIASDFMIMIRTVEIVIYGRGAY